MSSCTFMSAAFGFYETSPHELSDSKSGPRPEKLTKGFTPTWVGLTNFCTRNSAPFVQVTRHTSRYPLRNTTASLPGFCRMECMQDPDIHVHVPCERQHSCTHAHAPKLKVPWKQVFAHTPMNMTHAYIKPRKHIYH